MCQTVAWLRPFQSTKNLDGILTDRELIQDIAYDGEPEAAERGVSQNPGPAERRVSEVPHVQQR